MNLGNTRELSGSSHLRYEWAVNNKRGGGGGVYGSEDYACPMTFIFCKTPVTAPAVNHKPNVSFHMLFLRKNAKAGKLCK